MCTIFPLKTMFTEGMTRIILLCRCVVCSIWLLMGDFSGLIYRYKMFASMKKKCTCNFTSHSIVNLQMTLDRVDRNLIIDEALSLLELRDHNEIKLQQHGMKKPLPRELVVCSIKESLWIKNPWKMDFTLNSSPRFQRSLGKITKYLMFELSKVDFKRIFSSTCQ